MAEIVPVDDPADERIADYVGLSDADLRRRHAEFFVVEGALAIRHLFASAYPVRSVLLTERGTRLLGPDLAAVEAPVYVVSQPLIEAITGFRFHRGALASASRPPDAELPSLLAGARGVLAVEGVNDHENLGALFRNAAAFGVDAVVLDPTSTDPLYRRSVRVSMGHVLRVPFARMAEWPGGLAGLGTLGFDVLALTPSAGAEDLEDVAGAVGDRWALLVGAEGPGLTEAALGAAGRRVRISLTAGVDSLNVATAAAIALYRLASRRPPGGDGILLRSRP